MIGRLLCFLGFHKPGPVYVVAQGWFFDEHCARSGCLGFYRDDAAPDPPGRTLEDLQRLIREDYEDDPEY